MKICVIGLGKLGYPMAEFLSSSGHSINCYDNNEKTVLKLMDGENYLQFEKGLENFRSNGNKLIFNLNVNDALKDSEICFITVPTPSNSSGSFSNKFIFEVLEDVAVHLKTRENSKEPYIININSTIMPGSTKDELIPYLEKKGFKNNVDFSFLYNPYFVALGDVIKGLENPDLILVGSENKYATKKIMGIYNKIYKKNLISELTFLEAELTKLLVNCYLTLKISFSNMVKIITQDNNREVNINKILNTIGSDSRIGKKFIQAGGPFSGPCLPRDTKALNFFSNKNSYVNSITNASIKTNKDTIKLIKSELSEFKSLNFDSIIFAGVGYKSNTPSLEETFVLDLISYSNSIGFKVFYYDDYIKENIKNAIRIKKKEINKYSNLLFLPYIDEKFNIITNFKGYIYDIWFQLNEKNVIRSSKDIKFSYKEKESNVIKLNGK